MVWRWCEMRVGHSLGRDMYIYVFSRVIYLWVLAGDKTVVYARPCEIIYVGCSGVAVASPEWGKSRVNKCKLNASVRDASYRMCTVKGMD